MSIVHASSDDFHLAEAKIREADACLEAGLPVFLLKPRTKVPARRGWQGDATTDRRTLRRRIRAAPDCNLAVKTGGGIVAVDIDPEGGGFESFAEITAKHGHPPRTATSLTGGDGLHLLYRVEGPVANRQRLFPGIDVRGDGGLIVVPPSVHPLTGKVYSWVHPPGDGIAPLPGWLRRLLTRPEVARPPSAGRAIELGRAGDLDALVEDLIRRFPVLGPGRRNGQMNRAIASLAGRGFARGIILEALERWHGHHHGLGLARTDPAAARREAVACLDSKLRSPTFAPAVGGVDHRESCRRITLAPEVMRLIRSGRVSESGAPAGADHPLNAKRVRYIGENGILLCDSGDDRAFVEALLVHALHKVRLGEFDPGDAAGVLLMTHDQVREIVEARHGVKLTRPKLERLKRKYVGRPGDGKPASRFELLREVKKGRKEPGGPPGIPSEYAMTGMRQLLFPAPSSGFKGPKMSSGCDHR